ncbi:hypothetical protein VP01_2158g2 [Puccinia sorghi]|uniref:Uncharacterized protein n=1 Tax=Puccinia sorghi TaxID=27349 RepID=A0A0L6VBE6_9BASI|nr:hypothetical protein VP01_2158g2 [Puccinia sorghi]
MDVGKKKGMKKKKTEMIADKKTLTILTEYFHIWVHQLNHSPLIIIYPPFMSDMWDICHSTENTTTNHSHSHFPLVVLHSTNQIRLMVGHQFPNLLIQAQSTRYMTQYASFSLEIKKISIFDILTPQHYFWYSYTFFFFCTLDRLTSPVAGNWKSCSTNGLYLKQQKTSKTKKKVMSYDQIIKILPKTNTVPQSQVLIKQNFTKTFFKKIKRFGDEDVKVYTKRIRKKEKEKKNEECTCTDERNKINTDQLGLSFNLGDWRNVHREFACVFPYSTPNIKNKIAPPRVTSVRRRRKSIGEPELAFFTLLFFTHIIISLSMRYDVDILWGYVALTDGELVDREWAWGRRKRVG